MDSFNQKQEFWSRREQPGFNPYVSCNDHNQCTNEIDMNMICNEKNSTCQCRETMQWNEEALECQIFIVSFWNLKFLTTNTKVFHIKCFI